MNCFFVDAETDGLYGEVFSIGVLVYDDEGMCIDCFSGNAEVNKVSDEWCIKNVVPAVEGLPEFNTREELLEAFWSFWLKYRENSYCIADVSYPVETGLFRKCVMKDTKNRWELGPFPLFDLATMFYAKGIDPMVSRAKFLGSSFTKHNSVEDAKTAANCWYKLLGKELKAE